MKCLMCDGKEYYKVIFSDTLFCKDCDCEMVTDRITSSKKRLDYLKSLEIVKNDIILNKNKEYAMLPNGKYGIPLEESKYVMDESMIMSIAHLFLEMQDYDNMMEYASLLDGVDLGN